MPAPEHPIDGPPLDLGRLAEVLDRYGVEYLLVGGIAAGLHGAERPTEDADCVVGRERANLDRLAAALRELNARLRVGGMTDAEARTLPVQIDGTALDMIGMSTWMTDAGPFDVLAGLEAADGHLVPYEELAERAAVFQGEGFALRTAAIDDIITAKERAGRPKDLEALPELRDLQEREHQEAAQGLDRPRIGDRAGPDSPSGGDSRLADSSNPASTRYALSDPRAVKRSGLAWVGSILEGVLLGSSTESVPFDLRIIDLISKRVVYELRVSSDLGLHSGQDSINTDLTKLTIQEFQRRYGIRDI